jgi:hypothetical protein
VIEINVDEPQNDRLGSSPYRSGVILGPVSVDEYDNKTIVSAKKMNGTFIVCSTKVNRRSLWTF